MKIRLYPKHSSFCLSSGYLLFLFFSSHVSPSLQHEQQQQKLFPPSLPSNFSNIINPNPRLQAAYVALQALKASITSDPNGFTSNWCGHDVCAYKGVYCAPAPDENVTTVAGLDLNHAGVEGTLPEELGLLGDLALLHLNSNTFRGSLPASFCRLRRLYELDLSNNRFCGPFPDVVLSLPELHFFDIRFNEFEGSIPSALFDKKLDAIFLNNNNFTSTLPPNLANSTASVIVLANLPSLTGCIPPTISRMSSTLDEIILMNIGLTGCIPPEITRLANLKVLDVSFNRLAGALPDSISKMSSLEQLDVARNQLRGSIPAGACGLPNLKNFTFSYNYFCSEPPQCLRLGSKKDDRFNCIPGRPVQRSGRECDAVLSKPVDCNGFGCPGRYPSSPPPPPPPPPPAPPSPPPGCSDAPTALDLGQLLPPIIH